MSAPNDFNDIVRADPAGVVITVDHPRGAIDWHLAHPRAEQLIAAIRGRLDGREPAWWNEDGEPIDGTEPPC
jgi:hypothetical protein